MTIQTIKTFSFDADESETLERAHEILRLAYDVCVRENATDSTVCQTIQQAIDALDDLACLTE